MFIATANLLDTIQPAFLDRMEVIRLSGYTEEEKLRIARLHLIPKQMKENGLAEGQITFTDEGLQQIISGYTREAGLRNLERELAAVCRKVAVRVARGETASVVIDAREGGRAPRPAASTSAKSCWSATASASRPASPGPRWAATCSSSRSWRCRARGSSCSPASSAT